MAISKAEKAAYNDEIKDLKKDVDETYKKINEVSSKKKKAPNIAAYYNFEQSALLIKVMDHYLRMSDLSLEMLGIKNENFLNNARKEYYKIIQLIEEVVGTDMDRSLKENDDYVKRIEQLDPRHVLNLVEKLQALLLNLRNRFGEGSKWKWSFTELQSRVAIITKNIIKFSDIAKLRDPRSQFFYERRELMRTCKEYLTEAAKQWRTKYEMAGKAREDLKKSIDLLSTLRKIHILFGEDEEATKLKNTIDAGKMALQSEDKSKDMEEKSRKK